LAGALERAGETLKDPEDLRTGAKLNRYAAERRDFLIQIFAVTDLKKHIIYLNHVSGNYRGWGMCLAKAVALSTDDADKLPQYIAELREAAEQIEKAADTQNGLAQRLSSDAEKWEDCLRCSARDYESAGIRRSNAGKISKVEEDFLEAARLKQKAADQFERLAQKFIDSDKSKWAVYLYAAANNCGFLADDFSNADHPIESARARAQAAERRLELAQYYLNINNRALWETYSAQAALDLRIASGHLALAAGRSGNPQLYENAAAQRNRARDISVSLAVYFSREVKKAQAYAKQTRGDDAFRRELNAHPTH
jgi:hypothetical protein